jgi:hypothetical protein
MSENVATKKSTYLKYASSPRLPTRLIPKIALRARLADDTTRGSGLSRSADLRWIARPHA